MKKISKERRDYLDRKSVRIHHAAAAERVRRAAWARSRRRKFRVQKKDNPPRRSQIIGLLSDRHNGWVLPSKKIVVNVPPVFSLIDEPKNTINFVNRLAREAEKRSKTVAGSIFVDQSKMEKFDLAANVLLNTVVMEMSDEVKLGGSMPDLDFKGETPKDEVLKRYIRAVGLPKILDIESQRLSEDALKELSIFRRRIQKPSERASPYEKTQRETISEEFVEHVNSCLSTSNLELTSDGEYSLTKSLGEIIDNAELHSGMTEWSLYGYLDNSLEVPVFEVAMINFGYSIAETFNGLDEDSYAWDQVSKYINLHKKRNFFGNGWNIDDLLTIVALQPNISSKNSPEDNTRGRGTVHLLEFFNTVSTFCNGSYNSARMAIVSGSTHIFFDGTHQLVEKEDGRQVIAFNNENDLSIKPDSRYVMSLGNVFFPGTVIAIKFPMPAGLTEEI